MNCVLASETPERLHISMESTTWTVTVDRALRTLVQAGNVGAWDTSSMDPKRKRKFRFAIALSCALLLSGALAYTSFSTASEAKSPSDLIGDAKAGRVYQLTGKVVDGSIKHQGSLTHFQVRDREGEAWVAVKYSGVVPDPFRDGREVIVSVRKEGDYFNGEKDSLITKCPSKFTAEEKA